MITAEKIIQNLDAALKQFGEYVYNDKGAEEVMDVREITEALKDMPNEEILAVLKEVKVKHRNPDPLIMDITLRIVNIPEGQNQKIDALAKDEFWGEYM